MPITPHHRDRRTQQGFTMVVIAALFVAFAVIAAVAVERNTTIQQITRRDATYAQLTRLSNAIIEYSVFNKNGSNINLYPCPALLNVAVTSASSGNANFGKEVTTTNSYTKNCSDTTGDAGGFTADGLQILGASVMIRGMVPVLALSQYGITSSDALDPWNNRIIYVVNRSMTIGTSSVAQSTTVPTLTDNRTGYAYAKPDFLLISYGRDGLGGYKATGTTATIACPAPSTVLRQENCDDDTTFIVAPTFTTTTADAATYFDDILVWYRQ